MAVRTMRMPSFSSGGDAHVGAPQTDGRNLDARSSECAIDHVTAVIARGRARRKGRRQRRSCQCPQSFPPVATAIRCHNTTSPQKDGTGSFYNTHFLGVQGGGTASGKACASGPSSPCRYARRLPRMPAGGGRFSRIFRAGQWDAGCHAHGRTHRRSAKNPKSLAVPALSRPHVPGHWMERRARRAPAPLVILGDAVEAGGL